MSSSRHHDRWLLSCAVTLGRCNEHAGEDDGNGWLRRAAAGRGRGEAEESQGMCIALLIYIDRLPLNSFLIVTCIASQISALGHYGLNPSSSGGGSKALEPIVPKRVLSEFRVSPDMLLPRGTRIPARHFVPGQVIHQCPSPPCISTHMLVSIVYACMSSLLCVLGCVLCMHDGSSWWTCRA
jgi:hypothetical protein